jgi:hypothetical protein
MILCPAIAAYEFEVARVLLKELEFDWRFNFLDFGQRFVLKAVNCYGISCVG